MGSDDLIAHRNDDRPRVAHGFERLEADECRVTGAFLLLLVGVNDALHTVKAVHHAVGLMPDDDDEAAHASGFHALNSSSI